MCKSPEGNFSSCCPAPQIFQENICGNFTGSFIEEEPIVLEVWGAPEGDYIEGTFEVYHDHCSEGTIEITVTGTNTTTFTVPAGNSFTYAVLNPTSFTITAGEKQAGRYCLTLYKKILP